MDPAPLAKVRSSTSSTLAVALFLLALVSIPASQAAAATSTVSSTSSPTDTLVCSPTKQYEGLTVTCTSTVVAEAGQTNVLSFFNNSANGGYLVGANPATCSPVPVNSQEIGCSVSLTCQGPPDTVTVLATYGQGPTATLTATTNIVCALASSATISTSSTVPEFPQAALSALLFAALVVAVAVSSRRLPGLARH